MDSTRNARRLRLACEPCRRKKTRCPGEKPSCSFCLRLGQECTYYSPPPPQRLAQTEPTSRTPDLESRISGIEDKLDRLIDHINGEEASSRRDIIPSRHPPAPDSAIFVEPHVAPETQRISRREVQVPRELQECGVLYLTWCHKQPTQLFDEDTFLASLPGRDPELIFAVQALCLRFPEGSLTDDVLGHLKVLAEESRQRVMNRVVNGEAGLSSLQVLCILSCYNFTSGHVEKSRLDLTMAHHVKTTYYNSPYETYDRETRLCLQSIESLKKMHGCPEQATRLMSVLRDRNEGNVLPDVLGFNAKLNLEEDVYGELGGFASRLSDTWQMIRAYASSRVSASSVPPWDSRSDYNIVTQSHLRIDCAVPMKYRFSSETDLNNQTPEALQQDRPRWSALLFLHIVYAIVPCVLNHPFLLSMRLRSFRNIIPQSFVQQSYDHITRHAGWILYYISAAERMDFQPTDPCLAHCVVIVATIYIQHSFVKANRLRDRAQAGLETCLRFLDKMGLIWPVVANMAKNVRRLQQSVVPSPSGTGSGQAFSIDAQLLWDLLIYDRAGAPNAGHRKSPNAVIDSHNNLTANSTPRTSTEFDLIGSAGISGHRSAGAHIPVYAPGDDTDAVYAVVNESREFLEPRADQRVVGSMEDIYGHGIDGFGDQMDPMFLADDYGRAIDGWLDYF